MDVGELKEIIKDLPDNVKVEVNAVWDEESKSLTPVGCSGYYNSQRETIYITPDAISI